VDFERYVRNEVGIQELASLLGASGLLVTPEDARTAYIQQHEELSAQIVAFLALDQLPQVTVSTQTVAQFYTNQLPRYRLPERMQVSYVAYGISNYLAQAEAELVKTNFTEMIEANYQRLGTNYFKDAKTPEEAKAKIRENMIRQQAFALAGKQARDFANAIAAQEPVKVENLHNLAKEKSLTVGLTEPFDREDGPKELSVGPAFMQAAFKLTSDEPFTRPVPGNDAVYVLAFNRRLPSEVPSLESIRAQVTTDCRYEEAVALARQAGVSFVATLTNGLAQGKNFSELCTAAKLKPLLLPPVSLSTRSLPEVEQDLTLDQFKRVAFNTPPGKVSPLIPTRDGGLILHVRSRLPLDEAKMKTDLPAFTAYLRQVRQNDAFNEWFRKHADEGLRNTALAQMQAQAKGAPAPTARKKR
jgi:parvulin-like peptidyl-prolyl isomerase